MLKISPFPCGSGRITLRLEGRLVGPWVEILRAACGEALAVHDRVLLDLAQVSFIDAAGLAALREMDVERVGVAGCSGFIAQMLKEVESC